jgi:flagellar motility protein MotE (MotC chaperone)
MKKLLIVGVTSLILFAVSASASYFWQQKQKHGHTESAEHVESAHKEPASHGKPSATSTSHSSSESVPRAAVRPAYNPGAEEIARMTNELRSRLAAVREREEQLNARKKQVELIQEDIRGERTALDELRTQVKSEMDALNEALQNVEKQRGTLEEERQKISKNTQEMESRVLQLQQEEQGNLKKMSGMYNSMSPESAAKILKNLADTGKMDTAVKVLGMMQERQAAKVLAELSDAGLAAQLVEKLKSLRRAPPSPDGTKQEAAGTAK